MICLLHSREEMTSRVTVQTLNMSTYSFLFFPNYTPFSCCRFEVLEGPSFDDSARYFAVPKYPQNINCENGTRVLGPPVNNPKKTQKIECTTLRLGYGRRMYTMKYSRKILCTHDSKRYVHPCQKDSIALGHHRTFDSAWVDQLMKEKDPYTWPHMA